MIQFDILTQSIILDSIDGCAYEKILVSCVRYGPLAQLVEQQTLNLWVAGSMPAWLISCVLFFDLVWTLFLECPLIFSSYYSFLLS